MAAMPSPGSRRWLRHGLVAVAVLLVMAGGAVAFVLAHSPHNVSNPNVEFSGPTTTTPPPAPKPVAVDNFAWPRYGFDAQRTHNFQGSDPPTPPFRIGWYFQDYALLEFPPVIYQNALYLIDDDGSAKALDKRTGHKLWETKVGTLAAASPALTVFHDFAGGNDGDDPNSLIQASDGNFYGTTYLGVGTVFQVTPAGQFTTVFVLPPQNKNRFFYGDFFTSVVEGPDGFLYVIARGSNNNPNPMVFRISKSGSHFQVVLQEAPYSLSVASDGNFYGADGNGIFRLSTSGIYTLLSAQGASGFNVNGFNKQATDGNFYGTCYPVANGPQHVCRVTTSGAVTPIFQYPTQGPMAYPPRTGF